MLSSFNVIKNSRIIEQGNRQIDTQHSEEITTTINEQSTNTSKANMESYENIAKSILENARRQSDNIMSKTYLEASEIKQQAHKDGLEQGYKEGYEKAYNEAMSIAEQEVDAMRAEADSILIRGKNEYNKYLGDKEQELKNLIINVVESILKREVKEPEALNEMIFHVLQEEKNSKSYIIKCNNSHIVAIKDQIEQWKLKLAFKGDIFLIEDNFLDEGTAVIEKETGKSIVSIAYGIEKIIEVFHQDQIEA